MALCSLTREYSEKSETVYRKVKIFLEKEFDCICCCLYIIYKSDKEKIDKNTKRQT